MEHQHGEMNRWLWRIAIGVLAAALFTVLGCAIVTAAVHTGRVGETAVKWLCSGVWFVCTMVGAFVGTGKGGRRKLLSALIIAGAYLTIIWVMSVALFHQSPAAIGRGVASILAGLIVPFLVFSLSGNKKHTKWKYRGR